MVQQSSQYSVLLETDFPIEAVSQASIKEKSIRQEHISTLQQWWARRPLAVCRAAIFAALCPAPDVVGQNHELTNILNEFIPTDDSIQEKLTLLTGELSSWKSCKDENLLAGVRKFIALSHPSRPMVVDTFAGGGSFPVEALRLGLDTFASDLNPVAVTALRIAVEYLPGSGSRIVKRYKTMAEKLSKIIENATHHLYTNCINEKPLAFFWCHTYKCPNCNIEVPLLRDFWLEKGKRNTAVRILQDQHAQRFEFECYSPTSAEEKRVASNGTVKQTGATCPSCRHLVSTKWLRTQGQNENIGDRLYAKLFSAATGERQYTIASKEDEILAESSELRAIEDRYLKQVPNEPFDLNGIRHTWMIQYGITSTAALYGQRQGVALLEVFHELEVIKKDLLREDNREEAIALILLLVLTFNRLVSYGTRHAWWQSNGGFPASMFTKQAIPMVWNYVEIPVSSSGAAGWKSAISWIEKVATHLSRLPKSGHVNCSDAVSSALGSHTVDLVITDPPYYDSIAYSYLSDVYYTWLRSFLYNVFPSDFIENLSPKREEAIVDRSHALAPASKSKNHFYTKMVQSLIEARRILKLDRPLVIMYGHKKIEAWAVFLQALLDSGFQPVASWPVHTERKVKFRHGSIDSLSSSCVIICRPASTQQKSVISQDSFDAIVNRTLQSSISRFRQSRLWGEDLLTSVLAPAVSVFSQYSIQGKATDSKTIKQFLDELPNRIMQCEIEAITSDISISEEPELVELIHRLKEQGNSTMNGTSVITWLDLENSHPIAELASNFAKLLRTGKVEEADYFWSCISDNEKSLVDYYLRAVSLISPIESGARQLANASLSRLNRELQWEA